MNRSTGAYVPLNFSDFAVAIKLESGGTFMTVISETNSRRAIGRAFGQLDKGTRGKVTFCKTPAEMSRDERGHWDMLTDSDQRAMRRENDAMRADSFTQLDMY